MASRRVPTLYHYSHCNHPYSQSRVGAVTPKFAMTSTRGILALSCLASMLMFAGAMDPGIIDHLCDSATPEDTLVPFPGLPHSFIQCVWDGRNWLPYLMECAPGTIFDDEANICQINTDVEPSPFPTPKPASRCVKEEGRSVESGFVVSSVDSCIRHNGRFFSEKGGSMRCSWNTETVPSQNSYVYKLPCIVSEEIPQTKPTTTMTTSTTTESSISDCEWNGMSTCSGSFLIKDPNECDGHSCIGLDKMGNVFCGESVIPGFNTAAAYPCELKASNQGICDLATDDNYLFPYEGDGTKFWSCTKTDSGWYPVMMECAKGTYFDAKNDVCDYKVHQEQEMIENALCPGKPVASLDNCVSKQGDVCFSQRKSSYMCGTYNASLPLSEQLLPSEGWKTKLFTKSVEFSGKVRKHKTLSDLETKESIWGRDYFHAYINGIWTLQICPSESLFYPGTSAFGGVCMTETECDVLAYASCLDTDVEYEGQNPSSCEKMCYVIGKECASFSQGLCKCGNTISVVDGSNSYSWITRTYTRNACFLSLWISDALTDGLL